MSDTAKYTLRSSSFSKQLQTMFVELYKKENYCDVTLVCDDKTQFEVHKIVITTWSQVFKEIIDINPSHNLLIYLRGIQHQEMESLLQFMYLGECIFSEERFEQMMKVAEDLEIKDLATNLQVREDLDGHGVEENLTPEENKENIL